MIIAIDGTGGSGKGAIASHVAKELEFFYLDTGIYYRSVSYLAIKEKVDLNDEEKLTSLARNMQVRIIENTVLLNSEDVTYLLRSNEVNNVVSEVSSIRGVRFEINNLIRNYALDKNIVVDGRDIGSVVFPNADVKIYLDADVTLRARRRFEQNINSNIECDYETVLNNLIKRDKLDKEKEFGSLKLCADATYIDTSNLTVDEAIESVLNVVRSKLK